VAHLRIQTTSNPCGHQEPPWGPTRQPPRENTPPLGPGQPTPQVGQTDLVATSEWPPRGTP
jgi:hypothetical protein